MIHPTNYPKGDCQPVTGRDESGYSSGSCPAFFTRRSHITPTEALGILALNAIVGIGLLYAVIIAVGALCGGWRLLLEALR